MGRVVDRDHTESQPWSSERGTVPASVMLTLIALSLLLKMEEKEKIKKNVSYVTIHTLSV